VSIESHFKTSSYVFKVCGVWERRKDVGRRPEEKAKDPREKKERRGEVRRGAY